MARVKAAAAEAGHRRRFDGEAQLLLRLLYFFLHAQLCATSCRHRPREKRRYRTTREDENGEMAGYRKTESMENEKKQRQSLFFPLRRRGLSWTSPPSFFSNLCSLNLFARLSRPPPPPPETPLSTGPALRPQRRPRPLPRPEPRPHPRAPPPLRPSGAVLLGARLRPGPQAVHGRARVARAGRLLAVHQGRRALHSVSCCGWFQWWWCFFRRFVFSIFFFLLTLDLD